MSVSVVRRTRTWPPGRGALRGYWHGWAGMDVLNEQRLAVHDYGNKAFGLFRLIENGFAVPDAFVIGPDDPLDDVWAWANKWTNGAIDGSGKAFLAVRSSSKAEDNVTESGAGRFKSLLGTFDDADDLIQAVRRVRESGYPRLAVIVQEAVRPAYAGVAFSCDPVSFDRAPYVVSWTPGSGDRLVAGRQDGSLVVARSASDYDGQWPGDPSTLSHLLSVLDTMEAEFGGPVDVEWALDCDGKLWLLQARPVVLPPEQRVDAQSLDELKSLPGVIGWHSKMRLRLAASRAGVMMSKAVVLTSRGSRIAELPEEVPSADASGLSIVLIHPGRTNSKVQREFAQVSGMNVPMFTQGCRRYAIRRFPPSETALAVVNDVLSRGLEQTWIAGVVVQEIYDAVATGIVRRLGDDYVAELAVGHFVPKGVVDPSRFIISKSGTVVERFPVEQDVAYRFINGYVVTERPVEEQLSLSDLEISAAVSQVAPLFSEYPDAALEFGIMRDRSGVLQAYLIDLAEGDSKPSAGRLSRDLIRDGVLSPGRAVGEVVRIVNDSNVELDAHLLEEFDDADGKIEDVIFVADRASVDLLPLVARCGPETGFVFRHASLLAHLCVVLRERGIPAIIVHDDNLFGTLTSGSKLTVEAVDVGPVIPRRSWPVDASGHASNGASATQSAIGTQVDR